MPTRGWCSRRVPAVVVGVLALVAVRAPAQERPELGFEIVRAELPQSLEAGRTVSLTVTVQNTGSTAWGPEQGFSLSYHWLDEKGGTVVWDGRRTHLPEVVAPGARVTVEARVQAPARPGRYGLQWDVVQEGVCWISRRMRRPPPPVPVSVVPERPAHAFSVVGRAHIPRLVVAGHRFHLHLVLRNDGTVTWRPSEHFNVSYHWFRSDGRNMVFDGRRTPVTGIVPPGGTTALTLEVMAPNSLGLARLQIDMVHENVTWFAGQDPTPQPPVGVLLVPDPLRAPATPLLAALLLLALVVLARRSGNSVLLAAAGLADLMWLLLSMTVKQWAVLETAGRNPLPGCGWVAASGVALTALLLLALPRRWRPWLSWIVVAVASFVIFADVVYLRYFHDVLSVGTLSAGHQVGDVRRSIEALIRRRDLWLGIDLLPAIVLAALVARLEVGRRRFLRAVTAVALAALMIPGALTGWRAARSEKGVFVQVFQSIFVVQQLGILNYHLFDVWRTLKENVFRPPLGEAGYAEVLRFFESRRPLRRGTGPYFGVGRGMNLLMIQVESMQGWVPGLVIEGQEVTPNLDRFAPACLSFRHCTDQTNMGRTSDGEITTQTSMLPALHGVAAFSHGANHWVGLAGVLRDHGYATLSAVAFKPAFWNRRILHPAFGFEKNLYASDFGPGERIGWGLNDRDFLLQLADRIAKLPEPFCAWGITLSLHHPFEGFPEHLRELHLGRYEGTPFGNYLHAMHFFDTALGAMVDRLGELGLLDHTVVVIWGDHDSGLSWSRDIAQAVGFPHSRAGWYMADRVPLILHVPGPKGPRGVSTKAAGQTDVAPTVAALMGVDPASEPWLGRNLLGNPGPGPVPRPNGGWLSDRHLYVSWGPALSDGMCFSTRTLENVPLRECAAEDAAARREVRIADTILRYDLQARLARDLARGAAAGPSSTD